MRRRSARRTGGLPDTSHLRAEGQTDYVALVIASARRASSARGLCLLVAGNVETGGFREADLVALRRLVPLLALTIKCVSLARIARTLVEVYLGHDAGERVLSGRIARGVAERINAVIWYSDLRGYTRITDTAPPDEIIPLLNDYAGAVIAAVRSAGGEVLKLVGDGVLAIFRADDAAQACRCALRSEASLRSGIKAVNERRTADNRPITSLYLAAHREVFYGTSERGSSGLHVVGPAVNEASRIAAMCRSLTKRCPVVRIRGGYPDPERSKLVSGAAMRCAASDVRELFTLDPGC